MEQPKEPIADKTTASMIDNANLAASRLEAANKVSLELLERAERLRAQEILGGRAEAGQIIPEISDSEKLKNDMKSYFKGTVIGDLV